MAVCRWCNEPIKEQRDVGWVHEGTRDRVEQRFCADGLTSAEPEPISQAPPSPTPLLEAALIMREMFVSYLEAGFSEYQACIICGVWISSMGRGRAEES